MNPATPSVRLPLAFFVAMLFMTPRSSAQTSGLPFPADVRGTEVRLPTQNISVHVRYAIVDRGLIYFSPIFLEKAEINGQPLVAADGSMRVPLGAPHLLTLTFRDPEKGPSGRAEIRAALAAAPDVLQETGGIPPQPINSALVATERKVSLILRDPFQGNRPVALTGESRLADQEGNATPRVDFVLDADALNLLRRSRSSDIEIAFFQDYPARFETSNVVITVENLQRQVGELRQSIAPIPSGVPGGGGPAGIVLDAAFGSAVSQNGTLDKSSIVSDFIRRNVSFSVRYRSGASLDTPLVEKLVDFALNRASDFLQKSPFEGTNTFVTLLLSDDIQITTALGRLDEFATQMETGQTDELFTKLIEAVQSSQSVNIGTKASVFAGGGYGSAKGNLAVNLTRSEYLEQLRQEFHQSFRNASAWFKGSIPYLPGIRFSTTLGVDNIRWEDFRSALTEFTTGNITLYRAFNLGSLANRQSGLTLFEMLSNVAQEQTQLLSNVSVPLVQVGEVQIHKVPIASMRDERFVVRFPKPYASPPQVVTSLRRIIANLISPVAAEWINITASAEDIQTDKFTLVLNTFGGDELQHQTFVGYVNAIWTAVGDRPLLGTTTIPSFRPLVSQVPNQSGLAITEAEFAAQPYISEAVVPDNRNQFSLRFSSVPLSSYLISASSDLMNWFEVGVVQAGSNDLNSVFTFTPNEAYPHLFFKVHSQPN